MFTIMIILIMMVMITKRAMPQILLLKATRITETIFLLTTENTEDAENQKKILLSPCALRSLW